MDYGKAGLWINWWYSVSIELLSGCTVAQFLNCWDGIGVRFTKERASTEAIDAFVVSGPVRQSMANISCWFASIDWSHGHIHNLGRRLESRSPPIWKANGMVLANLVIVIHRLFAWSLVRDAFQDIASFLSREHNTSECSANWALQLQDFRRLLWEATVFGTWYFKFNFVL